MNKYLKIVIIFSLSISIISCTKKKTSHSVSFQNSTSATVADCSGYSSEMKIMYGLNLLSSLETLGEKGGQVFARLLAVDHMDGTMSLAILPPTDGGEFDIEFITALTNYNIKFIACNEDAVSALGGYSTSGVCMPAGPVNIVGGGDNLKEHQFTSKGFKAETGDSWTRVHATRNPGTDEGKRTPTFLMLVASNKSSTINTIGDYIIASGDSPYKSCYYGY